jgi:phospholipid/cholesterol/gamma-HCH transport system ATP-binding protein
LILELRARGVTQIVVSHDLVSIFSVADRIAMLYRGQVHIHGAPSELKRASDPVVRQFVSGSPLGPI